MPVSTRTLIVPVLCALALAACGGSGAAVREPSGRFAVTLDDYLIRPQQLHVPSGNLTITVTNRGRLGHTLRIRINDKVVLAFMAIPPGGERTRTFHLRKGRYTMFCAIGNHEELGMRGTLVIR
jgi:plastocyanin